jgi:hypothetical protein
LDSTIERESVLDLIDQLKNGFAEAPRRIAMNDQITNEQIAVERLIRAVKDFADGRVKDVARRAETPKLAALLVQKYGLGVVDAAAAIFESPRTVGPIGEVVDEETAKIDPLWREHARERWAGRPADVVAHS